MNTSTTNQPQSKPKNDSRWLPYFCGLLLVCFVLFLTAISYRSHLYYQYLVTFHDFGNYPVVEVEPLPTPKPPADWVKVTEGNLEFWLPPEIAAERHVHDSGIGGVLFGGEGDRVVGMGNPGPSSPSDGPEPTGLNWQPTTLRKIAELYQTDPNDFRWSMTEDEAAIHSYRVGLARVFLLPAESPVEVRFEEELDGLLTVFSDDGGRAVFQWESKTCPWEGMILFHDHTGNLDRQWVRTVCASVRFHCDADEASKAD